MSVQRNVVWCEYGEYSVGESGCVVRMSEASARIMARRYYAYMRKKRPDIVLTDDEVLEEFMVVNWATFDLEFS